MLNLDIKKIKQDILKLKSKDKGRTVSNYGGWQSKAFYDVDKNLKSLFNKINVIVESIEKKLCLSYKIKLGNYWHNVNGFGSFNRPHDHPKSVISGVYYISVPKNSGKIVFRQNNLNFLSGEVLEYNLYNSTTWHVPPQENLCVLFPSHLLHYVEPNLNKKERISISFNYGF